MYTALRVASLCLALALVMVAGAVAMAVAWPQILALKAIGRAGDSISERIKTVARPKA